VQRSNRGRRNAPRRRHVRTALDVQRRRVRSRCQRLRRPSHLSVVLSFRPELRGRRRAELLRRSLSGRRHMPAANDVCGERMWPPSGRLRRRHPLLQRRRSPRRVGEHLSAGICLRHTNIWTLLADSQSGCRTVRELLQPTAVVPWVCDHPRARHRLRAQWHAATAQHHGVRAQWELDRSLRRGCAHRRLLREHAPLRQVRHANQR
jgi:hypothetical protein